MSNENTTEECHLFIAPDKESERGFNYRIVPSYFRWIAGDDWIKVGDVNIDYVIPNDMTEDELRQKAINTLKEKQERVIAEAVVEKGKLQKRIDELLMITHDRR